MGESMQAEFQKLDAQSDTIIPTLMFHIKLSETDAQLHILGFQAYVKVEPNDFRTFVLGYTPISLHGQAISRGKPANLSCYMRVSQREIEVIEEQRGKNNLFFYIDLHVFFSNLNTKGLNTEKIQVKQMGNIKIEIPRSTWRDLLDEIGRYETFVLEVPVPPIAGINQLTEALNFLRKAELKFIEGEDMGAVVTNCRQALQKIQVTIDKERIDLNELFDEERLRKQYTNLKDHMYWSHKVKSEIKTIRGFCGPGPHIEIPVNKPEARYALIHTTAILSYLAQIIRSYQ